VGLHPRGAAVSTVVSAWRRLCRKLADKANRTGVAEWFPDVAVQKSMAGDLVLIGDDDQLLRALE
jgi:tetrahydromethanopterin S-methyltransferase subunit H